MFPPLEIAERGIDLDMENLFRTAGAGSDPADDDCAAGGVLDDAAARAMALPQVRVDGAGLGALGQRRARAGVGAR